MQASNAPPDHPPGLCMPHMEPGGQSRTKVESVWKSNEFQRFRHPRRRFFMHFCAFWLLPKFNARCSVNLMFAKSLFSEICTQKAHLPSWGRLGEYIRLAGRHCGQGAPVYPAAKVERVWKSNQSRNAPKVEGASPAEKSNDFARKNLRQSRIGFVLCTFVSWFRYIPRIFAHLACIIIAIKGIPDKVWQGSGVCGW